MPSSKVFYWFKKHLNIGSGGALESKRLRATVLDKIFKPSKSIWRLSCCQTLWNRCIVHVMNYTCKETSDLVGNDAMQKMLEILTAGKM